jgi:hypothetical protein
LSDPDPLFLQNRSHDPDSGHHLKECHWSHVYLSLGLTYLIVHEMLAEAKVGDGHTLVPFVQDNVA